MSAGPFVVTHRKPIVREPHDMDPRRDRVLSVKAVADLEAAREECIRLVQPYAAKEATGSAGGPVAEIALALMRTDWSGDSIELPDGGAIEVRPATEQDIKDAAFMRIETADEAALAAVIAAWNEKHAGGGEARG